MPGAALHILRAEKLPTLQIGQEKVTTQQIGLPGTEVDDQAATSLKLLGLSEHGDFDRYMCTHEELRTIDGRWNKKPIKSVIMAHRFDFFRHRTRQNLIFARGTGPIVRAAMKALKGPDLSVTYDPVDVHALKKELKEKKATMHAAFFSDLKIAKVRSATLYGEDVDQSEEYGRYDLAGVLSGIMIETVVAGAVEKFLVTHKRTIVVYHSRGERELLEFGLAVNGLIETVLPPAKAPPTV